MIAIEIYQHVIVQVGIGTESFIAVAYFDPFQTCLSAQVVLK